MSSAYRAVPLGEVAQFIRGITFKPEHVVKLGDPGTVGCMRTKNVQKTLNLEDVWGISEDFVKRREQWLQKGDILVSSANSWNLVGKSCWIPELPYRSSFGGFVSVLRSDPNKILPRYLFHWFNSDQIQTILRSFGQKTTNISNLNIGRCLELNIPLPSLGEQQRISGLLDTADALLTKRHDAIEKINIFLSSLFLEMFGDPVTNPLGWPTVELEKISEICRGRFSPRPRNDPAYYGGSHPFIQTGDIANSDYRLKKWHQTLNEKGTKVSKEFKAGTIVVAIVGATIGATSILEIDSYAPDSVIGIWVDTKKASNVYIEFLLRFFRPVFVANAPATARANINLDTLKPLVTQLPPIELQLKFENQVKAALNLQQKMWAAHNDCNALMQSLLLETFGDREKGSVQ